MKLREGLARQAVAVLAERLGMEVEACAAGIIEVADAIMAGAIRAVTVERGRDPRDFTLIAYGGAGPLHATALAADLSIPRVLIPPGPGTQGAFGMLVTDIRHDVARTVHRRLEGLTLDEMNVTFEALEREAGRYVNVELGGRSSGDPQFVHRMDLRYVGQFHPLTLTLPGTSVSSLEIRELFHRAHLERYGHNAVGEPVEATAFRVTALLPIAKPPAGRDRAMASETNGEHAGSRRVMVDRGRWIECAIHRRSTLSPGDAIPGPAVIEDVDTNIVLRPADRATALADGQLMIDVGLAE
jgi:N-methylhydantoinase A